MNNRSRFIIVCILAVLAAPSTAADLHHRLKVVLEPEAGRLQVQDTLELGNAGGQILFQLHHGLAPKLVGERGKLKYLGRQGHLERYALEPGTTQSSVTLSYTGRISHGLQEVSESLGKSHQRTIGTIGPEGVFLSAYSGWYPWIADRLQSFELQVDVPTGWMAVSQGEGPDTRILKNGVQVHWRETHPQDDIYLIAAPFELYRRSTPVAEAQVYLRQSDPALAERYLQATERYLQLYQGLLGDYPYSKFALVENFWASGYGMPSFTLLGERVIRLPFIAYTSYPHEILHNWWGNGVYADYASGNWSEGLTTYLADHLLKEQRGQGAAYRRDALQRFADYVNQGEDFPLAEFRSRHSSASQSVGYGKGFMLFHMLRRKLGDRAFVEGLRYFYRKNRFQTASYSDLQSAFEQVSGRDLGDYFSQWLRRTGAPTLAVSEVRQEPVVGGHRLTGILHQTQAAAPFHLQVPVLVQLQNGEVAERRIEVSTRSHPFSLTLEHPASRVDIDPRFDLFRGLYPEESPPTLSALFGSSQGLIVLPSAADAQRLGYFSSLAQGWAGRHPDWEIRQDRDLRTLPEDRPVWLLGWDNRFRRQIAQRLGGAQAVVDNEGVNMNGEHYPRQSHSPVLVAGGSTAQSHPIAWLGAHEALVIPGLARKLPHYGKYGWLVFEGTAPRNIGKGQWPVTASPLSVQLDDKGERATVQPLPPLTAVLN